MTMSDQIKPTDVSDELADTVVIDKEASQFDSNPINSDQRRSYRYPAMRGQNEAIIRRHGRSEDAVLAEESAGGIAVDVPHGFRLEVGDRVEVGIYSGWYRAQVRHIQPKDAIVRVGLQRIVAMAVSDEPGAAGSRKGVWSLGDVRRVMWIAVLLVVLVAAGLLGWMTGVFSQLVTGSMGAAPVSGAAAAALPNNHVLNVLHGVTRPETADKLKLSEEQRKNLRSIFVGTSNRLGALHEQTRDEPPHVWYEKSQAVVNEALEDILLSLTDEQIARWRELLLQRREDAAGDA